MSDSTNKVETNRQLLTEAQANGAGATLLAYTKLSGPGWLQSAITLGGGSLAGALFLGVLGGTSLLWLQLVAIIMGVVMLSAISYVTLSTGEKPFQSINKHINPVLGWGWLIATITANMIWCMPQFSLCFAALQKNLMSETVQDTATSKYAVSLIILILTGCVVLMNQRQGVASKIFDLLLKALVGMIVVCFFGVVAYLSYKGKLDWAKIFSGFIPDLSQATAPTGDVAGLFTDLSETSQEFWGKKVVKEQRAVMIGAAATAVGINMTFLLPYSMLNRGWDKPFRGLARFDLCTGMAIPYVIVTSCVVIASAASFHAVIDDPMKSTDVSQIEESEYFAAARPQLEERIKYEIGDDEFKTLSESEQLARIAALPEAEKRVAVSLVRRNAFQLSKSLAPLLGEQKANLVFGFGIFAMGFSTIIILMLINGFAFCELFGTKQGGPAFVLGCLVAGLSGASWPAIWDGPAKLWLAILTSSFGMMLLPIAYFTFFMMMNSKQLLGDDKPKGLSMVVWNVLMGVSVLGALAAAITAIQDKANDKTAGAAVVAVSIFYLFLVGLGFFLKPRSTTSSTET